HITGRRSPFRASGNRSVIFSPSRPHELGGRNDLWLFASALVGMGTGCSCWSAAEARVACGRNGSYGANVVEPRRAEAGRRKGKTGAGDRSGSLGCSDRAGEYVSETRRAHQSAG